MELHQVRYFLALARTLNFTRAAEECSVTQPALTKAIKKLEQELGGDLLHRERKLTQLTDLGKLVLPMLQTTYAAAQSVGLQARQYRHNTIAPLQIGLTPGVSAALITGPLTEIAKSIGGLTIELVELEDDAAAERLLAGEIAAALSSEDVAAASDRIDRWRLFSEPYHVLAAMGRWDPACAINVETLSKAVWIETGSSAERELFREVLCLDQNARIAHRGTNPAQLQMLVAADLGIMLTAEHMPLAAGVVAHRIEGEPVRRDVGLFAVSGRRYSAALDAFIKLLRARDWNDRAGCPGRITRPFKKQRIPVIRSKPVEPPLDPALVEATHLLDD